MLHSLFKIIIIGFIISFIGTLPFGSLNITAFQIAVSQNTAQALLFTFAAILVELIVVRITLSGASKFNYNSKVFLYLMPLTAIFLFYLSVLNFGSIGNNQTMNVVSNLFPFTSSAVILGVVISALNPMHFPFWIGWNSVLFSRNLLSKSAAIYTAYIVSVGLGSLAGFLVYILAGKLMMEYFFQYNLFLALVMGTFYLAFAIFLLFSFVKKLRLVKLT
jgi:threonine/homoserine/homoserine lactone efflux protein